MDRTPSSPATRREHVADLLTVGILRALATRAAGRRAGGEHRADEQDRDRAPTVATASAEAA